MRIAIIGSRGYPFVYSGYETFVAELCPRLIEAGHKVTVYCHRQLFPSKPQHVNGVRLVYVPSLEWKSFSQLSNSFLSTLHVIFSDADVVLYVNSANGPFGSLLKIASKPSAINVDGVEWERPKWKGLGARYFRQSSKMATVLFDEIVTDSSEMAKIYLEEFGSPSTTIAYGAYESFSASPGLLEQFGLCPGSYYLVVGRLVPDNNADVIVKAFEGSRSKRSLVVVGDVPYRDPFAQKVRSTQDPRIIFPGYVRDPKILNELFTNCYAYIHGHQHGGTNPTLLTALGSGCAILALDTRFSREVLNGGEFGLFFERFPASLTTLIDSVDADGDRIERLGAKSRSRLDQGYTWDVIARKYTALFESLIRKKNEQRRTGS
jgi:glycosyltransferase involved in cell wall biosynthesis